MKRITALCIALLLLLAVLSGCGSKSVTWEDYQAFLIESLAGTSPDPEGVTAIIKGVSSWDEIDLESQPWAKFFADDGFNASTWEEFQAAGEGSFNADYVDIPDGSGEPSGEPSAEPAA